MECIPGTREEFPPRMLYESTDWEAVGKTIALDQHNNSHGERTYTTGKPISLLQTMVHTRTKTPTGRAQQKTQPAERDAKEPKGMDKTY